MGLSSLGLSSDGMPFQHYRSTHVYPQTHGHTSLGEAHLLFRKYRNVELSALKN